MRVWITERTIAPKTAARKPWTSKPFTTPPKIQRRKPLITKVKRPRVKRLNGKVRRSKIGLIVILINPQRSANTSAVTIPFTSIPGTIYGRAKKASALTNQLRRIIGVQLMIYYYYSTYSNTLLPPPPAWSKVLE